MTQHKKLIIVFFSWMLLFSPALLANLNFKTWLFIPIAAFLFWPLTLLRPFMVLAWSALSVIGLVNIFHFGFFGIIADEFFIATLLRTNRNEAFEFFQTLPMPSIFHGIIWIFLCLLCLRFLWRYRVQQNRLSSTEIYACSASACVWIALTIWFISKGMDNQKLTEKVKHIYPSHLMKASLRNQQWAHDMFYQPALAGKADLAAAVKTIVVVLGESATAQRWSLLGYTGAETNLPLHKKSGVQVLGTRAQGLNTASALPYLLTGLSADDSIAQKAPSFIDIAQHAGYKTFVLNNSRFDNTTEDFYSWVLRRSADTYTKVGDGEWDEVLTVPLKAALAHPAEYKLIVLHTYGSHPKVQNRVPPTAQHFSDPYDNSIRYTSELLRQWIDLIEQTTSGSAMFLYASDHGLVLPPQNPPYRAGKSESSYQVPLLYWRNEAALSTQGFSLQNTAEVQPSNSLLGALAIQAMGYAAGRQISPLNPL